MVNTVTYYRNLLEAEKERLVGELKTVGRINPDNLSDWEPVILNSNIDPAEIEERASEITQFEDQSAIEFTLEERHRDVLAALSRIDSGNFGVCSTCNAQIEEERLSVNPAAATCKSHMG